MKKYLALLVVFIFSMLLVTAVSAEFKIKDLPADHWAASAVYDLVKLGITKGYPDGTFRGTKNITRYETAIFLSKFAKAIGAMDLKADIKALKDEISALKRPGALPLSGSYLASWKFGNLLGQSGGTRGTVASYRLKLSTNQNLGEGANVKINLDTMDYGYLDDGRTTTGGILATELLDIESNLKLDLAALGPVDLKLTFGPGSRTHEADTAGPLPSEVGVTYVRPYSGIRAAAKLWGMDVSGGYIAKKHPASGRVQSSLITATIGRGFEGVPLVNTLKLAASGDYISTGQFSSSSKDIRAAIALSAPLGEKIEASGKVGIGGSGQNKLMVGGEVALNDILNTGTVANIRLSKVGSDYIADTFAAEEFDMVGFDSFNRPLEEGTVNLGGEVTQNVSPDIRLVGKGDLRLGGDYKYGAPKGRLTAEGGISYTIAPNTTLDALYRIHQSKAGGATDTSDVAALGLLYNF